MIEVEKKFILSQSDVDHLINGAAFLGQKDFTDIYYDTDKFILTANNKWLRSREGKFELKIPFCKNTKGSVDQYKELEVEYIIRENLGLSQNNSIIEALEQAEYSSFCICKTTRKKYKKGLFTIDLDIVDFQDFIYVVGEIELMIDDELKIEEAVCKIISFAEDHGLSVAPVRSKVIEYLKQLRPEHYQRLVYAGVVDDY